MIPQLRNPALCVAHSFDLFYQDLGLGGLVLDLLDTQGRALMPSGPTLFMLSCRGAGNSAHFSSTCLVHTKPWVQLLALYKLVWRYTHACNPNLTQDMEVRRSGVQGSHTRLDGSCL